MLENIKVGVIGGDMRQVVAARELAEAGYETAAYGFDEYDGSLGMATRCVNLYDAVRQSDFIVLPLPYSLDGVHVNTPLSQSEIHFRDILDCLEPGQTVLAGKISATDSRADIKIIDYYGREDLSILNALPTALSKLH